MTHSRKQIYATCLSKESIPAIPFWNTKHPLPTRSFRFLRATVRSALWLHHAHPFVAATAKNLSHAEKQRVWSWSCDFQDLLRCSDCALSCAMRLLQTHQHLSRLSYFSNSGLEVGLSACQLPIFANCEALPEGDLFDMFFT